MNKRKLALSVVVAFVMPGIEILSRNYAAGFAGYHRTIVGWITSAVFLFTLWHLNQYLSRKTPVRVSAKFVLPGLARQIITGFLVIGVFMLLQFTVMPIHFRLGAAVPWWVVFLKLSMGFALIIVVQSTFSAQEKYESVKLINAQLLNENLEARLQALRQQINPHFLFNALSTLRTMVRANDASAEKFIITLSDVYRQLLKRSDAAIVTLGEEVSFLQSYVFMLQARFEGALSVEIEVLPDCTQKRLPALSLQLLVENCIKHNIISSAKPLHIKVTQPDASSIQVVNNLQPKKYSTEEASGTGLENLKKRYSLLNEEEGVNVIPSSQQFAVVLKLLP
jgi:two-component system LytT family sensor kinase